MAQTTPMQQGREEGGPEPGWMVDGSAENAQAAPLHETVRTMRPRTERAAACGKSKLVHQRHQMTHTTRKKKKTNQCMEKKRSKFRLLSPAKVPASAEKLKTTKYRITRYW